MQNIDPWTRVQTRLRLAIGDDAFASWFQSVHLERFDAKTVVLSVPTRFLKSWIAAHYLDDLTSLWREHVDGVVVELEQRHYGRPAEPPIRPVVASMRPVATPSSEPSRPVVGSALDPRLTFGTFCVADSNRLAHAAALQMGRGYQSLFIHGPSGHGKTHLLHAIAAGREKAAYFSAERFMYSYVEAIRAGAKLHHLLEDVDVLLIDDVHVLQGKCVLKEFSSLVHYMAEFGRMVVLAADLDPVELEQIDERLRSRLGGGLVAGIRPSEPELRRALIDARQPDIPEEVRGILTDHSLSPREIDGALRRLEACRRLTRAEITIDLARQELGSLMRNEPRRVKVDDIIRVVAERNSVSRADLLSQRRTANVVMPRQLAMYLAKTLTLRSLPEIGRRFGGRDHTTVLHAVRKIEGLVGSDRAVAAQVEALRQAVLQ